MSDVIAESGAVRTGGDPRGEGTPIIRFWTTSHMQQDPA
jgi:hypothetical protein